MGEILRLTWEDIDQERAIIRVSAEAKSHEAREVPMTADLVPVFEGIDRRIGKDGACPRVFADPYTGKALKDSKLQYHYERAVRTAKIVDLHFHDLRRTFASRLAERGVSLQTIADLLGHGATYVTERYAHLKPDTLREAVATLSRGISEVRSDTNLTQEPILKAAGE
jgi:integrase